MWYVKYGPLVTQEGLQTCYIKGSGGFFLPGCHCCGGAGGVAGDHAPCGLVAHRGMSNVIG